MQFRIVNSITLTTFYSYIGKNIFLVLNKYFISVYPFSSRFLEEIEMGRLYFKGRCNID